jgi:dynein heavy chain 1
LDDDNVIGTLEKLKKEAAEVTLKVLETDGVMQDVEQTTAVYSPLAHMCSSIFFIMEQLNQLHHFYQFSLDFFSDIFNYVLHENPALATVKDYDERLAILTRDLFTVSFKRASLALLNDDRITFAMLLGQIKIRGSPSQLDEAEYDFFLSKDAHLQGEIKAELTEDQRNERIQEFSKIPVFKHLVAHIDTNPDVWTKFWSDSMPELHVPMFWDASDIPGKSFFFLCIVC